MTLKRLLLTFAAVLVAATSLVGGAAAATGKAPVLDRQQLWPWMATTPSVTCAADGETLTVDYSLSGFSSYPYSGTSSDSKGTLTFAVVGGLGYLQGLQASFTLRSGIGTVTGSIAAVPTTKGNGTCEVGAAAAELEVRGAVYTALLPDGSTDMGVVDIALSTVGGSSSFAFSFDSTRSPELDTDQDGIWDGDDNCETVPNADQRDIDVDFVGDACDTYDNRPALTLLGELWADTKAVKNGNKLVAKVDHAIGALQAGQVSVACSDLASYITQVQSARGKTIPPATADVLLGKARHIRVVLGC